jgi:predicted small lipoprotein YifL
MLSRLQHRQLLRVAALAALGAALALSGCGRKGALDPPPSASTAPPPPAQPALGETYEPNTPGYRRPPREPAVAPTATGPIPPDQRSFILDPLIR